MHRPMSRFYSDSDDDRPSSCDSVTSSASQCPKEHHLPSSLRKLLNPPPPLSPPSPVHSPRTDIPQAPLARICLAKQENQEHSDLSRLRPWKRLPSPCSLNLKPPVPLPPIYFCLPSAANPDHSLRSSSPISPKFNPYYLPAPRLYRERMVEPACQIPDATCRPSTNTPSSANPCALADANNRDMRANSNRHDQICRTRTTSLLLDPTRSERPSGQKNFDHARDKERNRCLTCGSSFSTFANLTRHEKKCPVATTDSSF